MIIGWNSGKALFVAAIALALGLLLAAGPALHWYRSEDRLKAAFERLQLIHELRAAALEDLIVSLKTEVKATSINPHMKAAVRELLTSWRDLGPSASQILRNKYLKDAAKRPPETASEQKSEAIENYDRIHQSLEGWAERFLDHFGYYDFFLIDENGNVLYTKAKEDDFGQNLLTGRLRESNLAKAVQAAMTKPGTVALADYEFYGPSGNKPAAFAASAILDDGVILGALVVQLPREPIEAVLGRTDGLGRTGETYAVGPDGLMRNQSRFIAASTLLAKKIDTEAVSKGLSGMSGAKRIVDYRNVPVLSVWGAVRFGESSWVLIAEIDEQEVLAAASTRTLSGRP